jgi:hypothetical protein
MNQTFRDFAETAVAAYFTADWLIDLDAYRWVVSHVASFIQ